MKNKTIVINEQFPILATDLKLQKYGAIDTLGSSKAEEAAVRLLMFSKDKGNYVGVSWADIQHVWIEEYMEIRKAQEIRNAYREKQWKFESSKKAYKWKMIFTLGIAGLFITKPTEPEEPQMPASDDIFSVTLMSGMGRIDDLANGFARLFEEGLALLKSEPQEGDAEALDYVYPTPALVSKLMRLA